MPADDGALSLAERHLTKAQRIVNQQKARIARLRAIGADTIDAEQTLRMFEANLKLFEEQRDVLNGAK